MVSDPTYARILYRVFRIFAELRFTSENEEKLYWNAVKNLIFDGSKEGEFPSTSIAYFNSPIGSEKLFLAKEWNLSDPMTVLSDKNAIPREDVVDGKIYFSSKNEAANRLLPYFGRHLNKKSTEAFTIFFKVPESRCDVRGSHNDHKDRFYQQRFFLLPGVRMLFYKFSGGSETNYTGMSSYLSKNSDEFVDAQKDYQSFVQPIFENRYYNVEESSCQGALLLEINDVHYKDDETKTASFSCSNAKNHSITFPAEYDSVLIRSYSYGNWNTTYFIIEPFEKLLNPPVYFRI